MAQQWDYKFIFRHKGIQSGFSGLQLSDWEVYEDGKLLGRAVDIQEKCRELGRAGWELVAVTPRSTLPGQSGEFSGVTTEEVWVFKRVK